jgi:hypothetical protein
MLKAYVVKGALPGNASNYNLSVGRLYDPILIYPTSSRFTERSHRAKSKLSHDIREIKIRVFSLLESSVMFHTMPLQMGLCRIGRGAARRQARATKAPTRVKRQAFGLTDFAAFLVNFSSFFGTEISKTSSSSQL